jgi:hypothetical protein
VNTMPLILWKHWPATWFENMEKWFPLTSKVCGGARSSWFRLCAKASAFLWHVFWGMISSEVSKVGLCHCPSAIVLGFLDFDPKHFAFRGSHHNVYGALCQYVAKLCSLNAACSQDSA